MHIHNIQQWEHSHRFNITDGCGERNTRLVIILTVVMMVVEIFSGIFFGSMALLADGWHMGTHAAALGITLFAYSYARRYADDPMYSFGTGKVGALGGFASAAVLAVVALLMIVESTQRLFSPVTIHFNEAIAVAFLGLAINLISAFILQGHHGHDHANGHTHVHHQDHNLRAAYMHVLADALTSVLAIFALLVGKMYGWVIMDPLMGIVGALVISKWSYGLLIDTSRILLDSAMDKKTVLAIRSAIESDSDNRITDLHIWPVGSNHFAAIISIVTHFPKPPDHYKKLLTEFEKLSHISVEVIKGPGDPCIEENENPNDPK